MILRTASIWILALMAALFAAQATVVRRAGGAFGNGIGYWLCAGGALCTMFAYLVPSTSLMLAFSILSTILFLSGTIALIAQLRRIARSREPQR